MECPFHAGNEAITACVQCETPICPLCASETNQVHLCLNCYRARVEELSTSLGSASMRLAKERQKGEAKALATRKKKKGGEPPTPVAKSAFAMGASEPIWEKEEVAPVAPGEMAPPVEAPPNMPGAVPVAGAAVGAVTGAAAAAVTHEALSKKDLARMQKEEAKRLKEEEKAAKKAQKAAPEIQAAPVSVPEPAPFFEPTPEPPAYAPPLEEIPPVEAAPAFESPPPSFTEMPPPGYPVEPPEGGVKLPRLDERLEPLPPSRESGEMDSPPGMEPPEGFFD
jgi:hypothetical protein